MGTNKKRTEEFVASVKDRTIKTAVIGLGYVGLPLALTMVERGFTVIGYDLSQSLIFELKQGNPRLITVPRQRLCDALATGRFLPTCDSDDLKPAQAYIICVPTPLDHHHKPDLSFVINASKLISKYVKRGDLVTLESTTYPGTTEEIMVPELEKSGLKVETDFDVAYSPEREDPGNKNFHTAKIPKVVGADCDSARQKALALYSAIVDEVVPVSSCKVAEAAKVLENIYRAVNISLVNELKTVYDAMGIDIWEVINAAKTKPFGFTAFYPGPGMGGHCIPVDPFYLTYRAKQYGVNSQFIELAGTINRRMPHYVLKRLEEELNRRGKELSTAKVLVMGLAYKPDIADIRESPCIAVMRLLKKAHTKFEYFDPLIPKMPHETGIKKPGESLKIEEIAAHSFDAGVLVTAHSCFDYKRLYDSLPLIVDTRNAFAHLDEGSGKIVKA